MFKFSFMMFIIVGSLVFSGCFGSSEPKKEKIEESSTPIATPELDKLMQETKDLLNSNAPNTTEADFNKTEFGKNLISKEKARKSVRAHTLVATAVDPDPEWFGTKVDEPVIVAKKGGSYTVHLDKVRVDGSVIGRVDNDKLRLVVRIQRDDDTYDYVTNIDIDKYAKWNGAGVLDIHVPDNLEKGRLLVGVRPDFTDVATSAIAERWSTVITAEVWQTKPNVKTLDATTVLFPIETATGFASESKFSKEEVGEKFQEQLTQKELLTLPLIVKDITLKKDDLISYIYKGKPYAGKVFTVSTKDNQQLILMTPEYFEVYDITGMNENATINNGLYPEHVVYREGGAIATDTNESDPTKFSRDYKESRGKGGGIFDIECSHGQLAFTFEPKFVLYPLDVGVSFSTYALADKVECTINATSTSVTFQPPVLGGGPATLIMKIFGTAGKMSYIGNETVTATGLPSAGFKTGWSLKDRGSFQHTTSKINYGSRDISSPENASSGSLEIAASVGAKFELNAISPDGYLGDVFSLFDKKDALGTIGVEATVGPKVSYAIEALNAREVYDTGNSSGLAVKVGVVASAKFSNTVDNFFKYIGIDSIVGFEKSIEIKNLKGNLDFAFNGVTDNGQGSASVDGLAIKSRFLATLFPESSGVLAPKKDSSSVFNDKSEAIKYDLSECTEKITSPIIACAGWMCGKVDKEAELCKGKLSISPVYASAKVGSVASASAKIVNRAGDITVNVSGSPLEPSQTSISMTSDSESSVKFSKECTSAGVIHGTVSVQAVGASFKDEAKSVLVCHDDDTHGDPHMVTADKLGYDYYASGDYILSHIKDVYGYEVQARFLPGYKTSWPQAVALQVGNDIVEIQGVKRDGHGNGSGVPINALAVWVNGKKGILGNDGRWGYHDEDSISKNIAKLPSGGVIAVTHTDSSNVLRYASNLTIIWPEGSSTKNYGVILSVAKSGDPFVHIQIARPNDFAGKEQGLMGNNNGDPSDDFIRRNGQQLGKDTPLSFTALYALFGADWLVREHESLFRNPTAIKPKFPSSITTLTAKQRALGESVCGALTGYYREACIMDVGLTGKIEMVKEYYANTQDLNSLSDAIVAPNADQAIYTFKEGEKQYQPDSGYYLHYTQNISIVQESGKGKFMLLVRPPKGASASLGGGDTSLTAEGNYTTHIEVDCTELNSATDSEYLQSIGVVQLWLQDPLSGTASKMVSEAPLVCTDASKRAGFSLHRGGRIELDDSTDTNLHYTQSLSIIHTNSYVGEYILEITPPAGAVVKLNESSTELNITDSQERNDTLELDCSMAESNASNGSIKLWEKDMLSGTASKLYGEKRLSCERKELNPKKIGLVSAPGGVYTVAISADSTKAFINYGYGYSAFGIVDISDLEDSNIIGSVHLPTGQSVAEIVISSDNTKAFLANLYGGLQIIDISDLTNPKIIGSVDIGYAQGVTLSSDNTKAFVTSGTSGLQIVDISDLTNPKIIGSVGGMLSPIGIALSNDNTKAFVASGTSGLQIVDISDLTNPKIIGSVDIGYAQGVTLSSDNTKAFVASVTSGLQIVDISNIEDSKIIGSVAAKHVVEHVVLSDDETKAFLTDGSSGLQIVDISDLKHPKVIKRGYVSYASGVALSNNNTKLFVADSYDGLYIIDLYYEE